MQPVGLMATSLQELGFVPSALLVFTATDDNDDDEDD